MRVLTVDDSRSARLIVRRCFEDLGFEVFEAANGQAALDLLRQKGSVEIIVLDWNMPVMDGFTCLTEIRKLPAYTDIKVLVCTTEGQKTEVMRAIRSGANGYILKPATDEKLREGVAKALGVPERALAGAGRGGGEGAAAGKSDGQHVASITSALVDVFKTHLHTPIRVAQPEPLKADAAPLNGVSGVISFSGSLCGQVVVHMPEAVAAKYAQEHLRLKELPEGAAHGVIRELASIISHRAECFGGNPEVRVYEATVVDGTSYRVCPPDGATTVIVPCNCTQGDFTLLISLVDG